MTATGSRRAARSSTVCSRRAWRRPPAAIPGACSSRCAIRCWRPASASGRCSRSPRPRRSRPSTTTCCSACARGRAGALLLADPRRSARDGRRRLPPRSPEQPQGVRRSDRDPRRRRAADAGVRVDRGGGRARRASRSTSWPRRARSRTRRGAFGMVRGQARDLGEPPPADPGGAGDPARREDRRAVPRRARGRAAARPARAPTCSRRWPGSGPPTASRSSTPTTSPTPSTAEHAAAARDRLAALIADAMRGDRAARFTRGSPGRARARTRRVPST